MASITLEVFGGRAVENNSRVAMQRISAQCQNGTVAEGDRLISLMQARTPYRTGSLKASGQANSQFVPDGVVITLSFGDSNVNYAIPVHERVQNRHAHGRAKYMESVVQEESGNIGTRIAGSVR